MNWSYSNKVGIIFAVYRRMRSKGIYWSGTHKLVGNEFKKRFGVASSFMLSFVIEIYYLLSVPFSSSLLDIDIVNV